MSGECGIYYIVRGVDSNKRQERYIKDQRHTHIGLDPILLIVRIKKKPAEEFADDCPSDRGMGGAIQDSTTMSKYKTRAIIIGIVALTVPSPITGCSVTLSDKPSQNALHHAEISHPARWTRIREHNARTDMLQEILASPRPRSRSVSLVVAHSAEELEGWLQIFP